MTEEDKTWKQEQLAWMDPGSTTTNSPKNRFPEARTGRIACADCLHHYCRVCEQNSAPKCYSDFWICHRCGELNRRV